MTPEQKTLFANALRPLTSRVRKDITAIKSAKGMAWTTEPLTQTRLEQHVNGGPARGVCPIKEGESVTMVALLDFDSHKGETPWPEMTSLVDKVVAALETRQQHAVVFRSSGGLGIHAYLLWDEPQDAFSVRAMLSEVLAEVGMENGAKGVSKNQVEIFPKQDSVPMGGNGNQFILPLAGKSEPLDLLFGLEPMGREWALTMPWPSSAPVQPRVAPVRQQLMLPSSVEPIERVRAALMSIPNTDDQRLSYDEWRDIGFAVHEATGGSYEGLEVYHEFSARFSGYDEKFTEDRVWNCIRPAENRDRAVTRATLFAAAYKSGWQEPTTAVGFEDVPTAERMEPESEDFPAFSRDKQGHIKPTIGNLVMALRREDITGMRMGLDRFRDEIMLAAPGTQAWRTFGDADYVWLRERLEKGPNGFNPISKETIRDVVVAVAAEKEFDSAILWLKRLPDDGGSRCETFLIDYFNVEDTPYHRAVSLYMWTAMAGRVLSPGCKADMVPILVGGQGVGKSTAIEAMAPAPEFFVEVSFQEKDDDLARKMRGRLLAEIGELRGLHTKELESIKAFVTRTHENWIPKYREFATTFPRRLVFIGSTNKDQFLADETGQRRWLPVPVGQIDVSGVRAAAPLLWAEAARLFQADGVQWANAQTLAKEIHDEYTFQDAWVGTVKRWLEQPLFEVEPFIPKAFVTTSEVLMGAFNYDAKQIGRREEMRMGVILKELGYTRKKMRIEGHPQWVFVPASALVGT